MKPLKFFCVILALAVLLTGCAPLVKEEDIRKEYCVYASFYPVYALSKLIIDDIPEMKLLCLVQPQDGCMRSYALSDWDLYLAADSDCVIVNGNGLETFESILMNLGENGPSVISATGGMILEKPVTTEDSESHFYGANPWAFLSVEGAWEMTRAVAANMIYLDPAYEPIYLQNLTEAEKRFYDLKEQMNKILTEEIVNAPVAVAHEGLLYFALDHRLNVAHVIQRESGVMLEADALDEMLKKLGESGAEAVLIEKQAPDALVKAFEDAGYGVALMDTLSTRNASEGAQGYFEAMLYNAQTLMDVLIKDRKLS